MKTLFLLIRSPYERRSFYFDLEIADEGDGVVFMQDGVLSVANVPEYLRERIEKARKKGVRFYAIEEDLKARGIGKKEWVEVIDYNKFVEILPHYKRSISP